MAPRYQWRLPSGGQAWTISAVLSPGACGDSVTSVPARLAATAVHGPAHPGPVNTVRVPLALCTTRTPDWAPTAPPFQVTAMWALVI